MSVYRTIGPLVLIFAPKHRLWVLVRIALAIYVLSKNKKYIKISTENYFFLTKEKSVT